MNKDNTHQTLTGSKAAGIDWSRVSSENAKIHHAISMLPSAELINKGLVLQIELNESLERLEKILDMQKHFKARFKLHKSVVKDIESQLHPLCRNCNRIRAKFTLLGINVPDPLPGLFQKIADRLKPDGITGVIIDDYEKDNRD